MRSLLVCMVLFLLSCNKNTAVTINNYTYSGKMVVHTEHQYIDSIIHKTVFDTTYNDIILVEENLNSNQILFQVTPNAWSVGSISKFIINASNSYSELVSTHTFKTFQLKSLDSLSYQFNSYGGQGGNYSSSALTFLGKK